jgi:hypothetical protein
MKRIGLADHVIVVLSDKYLRSPYCMTELHSIHQRSVGEKEDFLRRIIPLRLDDARFGTWRDRLVYTKHWRTEFEEMELHFKDLGELDFRLYKAMQEWHNRIGDMLAYPTTFWFRMGLTRSLRTTSRSCARCYSNGNDDRPTGEIPGLTHQRFGLQGPVSCLEQQGQGVQADGDVGMVGPQVPFIDGQRPAIKRFGFREPVGGLQQLAQVLQVDRDIGTVRPQTRFDDCQRPAHQRFGFREPVGSLEQLSQVVEFDGERRNSAVRPTKCWLCRSTLPLASRTRPIRLSLSRIWLLRFPKNDLTAASLTAVAPSSNHGRKSNRCLRCNSISHSAALCLNS